MKRVILPFALLLAGCASSPQSLIVGKWEVEGAPIKMTAEFNRDGSARLTMFGQTLQASYKLDGDDQLQWTVNGISTKAKVHVSDTELELTTAENQTIKYKRK